MDPTAASGETFDWFVQSVKANLKAKQTKATEAKYKQIGDAAQAVQDFAALLQGKPMQPDEKKKALKGALKTLVKALCGPRTEDSEIPNEIASAIDALADPDPTHKKQWDDALKALKHWLARVIAKNKSISSLLTGGGKTTDALKGLDDLIGKVDTLVKVLCGNATEAERDQILKDSAMDLLTSTVVVEQLKWFVTENALTYVQAVKIGYQLGEPIGKQLAADLTKLVGIQLGKNAIVALESTWTSVNGQPGDGNWITAAAGGDRPTTKLGGAFSSWTVQAYYDAGANGIRILCQNGDQTIVLDGNGNIATDSGVGAPQAAATTATNDGATTGYRPWVAYTIAIDKSKGLKDEMDAAQAAYRPSLTALTALQNEQLQLQLDVSALTAKIDDRKAHWKQNDDPVLSALQADLKKKLARLADVRLALPAADAAYKIAHGAYWIKYLAYTNSVRQWLMKAASAEKWTDDEIAYAALKFPAFAFSRSDLAAPSGTYGLGVTGHYAPRALTNVLLNYLRQSRAAQASLLAATLIGAVLGLQLPGGTSSAVAVAPAATSLATAAPVATALRTGQASAFDPCTLVTTAEASAILGRPVTAGTGTSGPSAQCGYQPQTAAIFQFRENDRTAQIKIDLVIVTLITGPNAQSRWSAAQAAYGKDKTEDDVITGFGETANYTGTLGLSILQASSFLNVATRSDRDWGSGSTRYEDVHQKYMSILADFARPALARIPAAVASGAPATALAQPVARPAEQPVPQPTVTRTNSGAGLGGAVGGGLLGLVVGLAALAAVALARGGIARPTPT